MAVYLSPLGGAGWQFFDNNGNPLAGGLLYTYAAGTTTPQTTYTTAAGNVANANPIVLDSAGRIANQVWLTEGVSYKFELKTSLGTPLWVKDNVAGINDFSNFAASGGSALIGYLPAGAGAVATTVQSKLRESVSIFDFMSAAEVADVQAGTLLLDCTSAFNTALAASKNIYFPPGKYRFNSTITITGARGLVLRGAAAALLAGGTGYTGTTELVFDNAPSGSNGIVFENFTGVVISDMTFRMRRGGVGAGFALFMYNGHDYLLQNLKFDTAVNVSGGGVKLGNGSAAVPPIQPGAYAAFVGNLQNIKCIVDGGQGPGIKFDFGTSTTVTNCYVIGGWIEIDGMAYMTLNSCAVDSSSLYAYITNGASNVVFNACGAEGSQKGAFYFSRTSSNIMLNAPYGADNNKSADANIGDLVHLDSSIGAVGAITVFNPTSVAVNPATAQNIWASAGTGFVEVYGTDLTLFSKGFGGNATWIRDNLTVTGIYDQMVSWTPVLSLWTNVGSPTVVGKYKRVGKIVTFYVTVTPATSISSTVVTSSITGFPFTSIAAGSATMTDGNAVSYGACAIGPGGIIYPQTSGVLTTPLTFVGTVVLP